MLKRWANLAAAKIFLSPTEITALFRRNLLRALDVPRVFDPARAGPVRDPRSQRPIDPAAFLPELSPNDSCGGVEVPKAGTALRRFVGAADFIARVLARPETH